MPRPPLRRRAGQFLLKTIEKRGNVCYNVRMEGISVKAYAKINFSLDITGCRGGYHLIDSVVASIDIFDEVTVSPRTDGAFTIAMHGMGCEDIPPEGNNALRAAKAFGAAFGCCGADISIRKNIPVGGSSADVAGVLNALSRMTGRGSFGQLKAIADGIGSDCGYMLGGGFARLTGRGERVCPISCNSTFYLLIALPGGGVSTAACYALSDVYPAHRRTSEGVQRAILRGQPHELGASLSNGLYPAAAVILPEIRDALSSLSALGCCGVNMSGSGSAVYALFADEASRNSALKNYRGSFPVVAAQTIL